MESYYPPLSRLQTTTEPSGLVVLQPPRCSVYPNLLADYYCLDCHCFVSSHGHVRGAHRNHRFVTIREAAELHVPAMRTWADRCEAHLQRAESILDGLGCASRAMDTAARDEEARLDAAYESIVSALSRQRDTLKRQLRAQVAAGQSEATQAWRRVGDLVTYYSAYLEHCAALMVNVPPLESMDTATILWSADVMRTAELLRSATQVDDVWLPELAVPRLASHCTSEMMHRLLHLDIEAFTGADGVTLPAALDVRPFQFPDAPRSGDVNGGRERGPASLVECSKGLQSHLVDSCHPQQSSDDDGTDAAGPPTPLLELESPFVTSTSGAERASVVIFNRQTSLTRAPASDRNETPDPSHLLVRTRGSFSKAGLHGWTVHIDLLGRNATGTTTGLVLAGIVQPQDPDGDGVVWDGPMIAGPRDGQAFAVPAAAQRAGLVPRLGSTMQFVLELGRAARSDGLYCFLDDRFVCRVALPAGRTWSPSVSVLTAEEQVTVCRIDAAQAAELVYSVSGVQASAAGLGRTRPPARVEERTPVREGGVIGDAGPRAGREGYSPELKEILDYVEGIRPDA